MRILVVGDIHCPVDHPAYLAFCRDLQEKHKCNQVVLIGDVVDHNAISFHAHHPDAPGPKDEHELALAGVARWYKAFPKAKVCIGNHDERVLRVAEDAGIPSKYIRTYKESWETPGWDWQFEHSLDDVYLFHGTGCGGMHPAFNTMNKMLMSVVMGHIHSASGVKWKANPNKRIFGMDTGCGIDDSALAFAYGRHQKTRSILSAGVVIDGIPQHFVMPCGPGERFHRSKFKGEAPRKFK